MQEKQHYSIWSSEFLEMRTSFTRICNAPQLRAKGALPPFALPPLLWESDAERAPHVPGAGAAVGGPRLGDGAHFGGVGEISETVRYLDAATHTEVVDREHVRPAEAEDKVHLGGPATDPFDGRHVLDDLLIIKM